MHNYKITVPCKSYIRKYFCYRFGTIGDTITLSQKTDIEDVIVSKLYYKPVKQVSREDLQIYLRQLDSKIRFIAPIDMFYRVDNKISDQQVYAVNRYMERVFKGDIHFIMQLGAAFGISKVVSARAFLTKYDITEEEITIEAIKKSYNRKRSSPFAESFFLAGLSSPFSDMNQIIPGQGRVRSD